MRTLRPYHWVLPGLAISLAVLGCIPKNKRSSSSTKEPSEERVPSSDDAGQTADSEAISPPVPITGSFLQCEINDKELAASNRAEVACRVGDGSQHKVDLAQGYRAATWFYQYPSDPNVSVSGAVADPGSPFHIVFSFQGSATAPLSAEMLQNFLVMFKARPVTAAMNQFIFSARLAKPEDNRLLLPENFAIYFANGVVINNPAPGFERRILPTVNHTYPAIDGCYIACYSNSAVDSVYPVGENTYVMGQIRVKGIYSGRLCLGSGFENVSNITEITAYKESCGKYLPACAGNICWGGNDTGGWFGLQ